MTLRYSTVKKTFDTVQSSGGNRPAGRLLNLDPASIRRHLRAYEKFVANGVTMDAPSFVDEAADTVDAPVFRGMAEPEDFIKFPLPPSGTIYTYFVSSAQNNTHVDQRAWENLEALRAYYKGSWLISTFTYNPNQFGDLSTKRGTAKRVFELAYDKLIEPHICDHQVQLAPGLAFCGRSNISPTSQHPLTGLETHTGRRSAIYPHTRQAMESVASGKHEATKLLYTTGAVTQINYVQKLAGQKAEHHHTIGALIVEVNSEGHWYVRQLNADRHGTIFDDEVYAENGVVKKHGGVDAVVFGDVHAIRVAPEVVNIGRRVMDKLNPSNVIVHDILDFYTRGHHELKDPFAMYRKHVMGMEDVGEELRITANVINVNFTHKGAKTTVVDSNHDRHLERWLKETDWKKDLKNALTYVTLVKVMLEAINDNDVRFMLPEYALRTHGMREDIRFLRLDENFILGKNHSGGIELGYHGDIGAGGSRGSAKQFAKFGRKTIIGHSHSARIVGGCFQVGTSSQLDLGYNSGPGAWSWTHCIVHRNGKRQMITMYDGAYRGEGRRAAPTLPRSPGRLELSDDHNKNGR